MRASIWATPLSLALLLAAPAAADQWQKTWRISGRPELVLRADDASVRVETWERSAVGVEIETRGLAIGPRGLRISDRSSGNRVMIEARDPRPTFSIGFTNRWVRILVHVPRGVDLDLGTGDGSVTVEPVSGSIRVATGDGAITLEGARGALDLDTGDGAIRAHDLEGTLIARTADGSIRVSGRFTALDLETGDGSIAADAAPSARARQDWRVVSGDGSVTLRVPEDFRADLDARTGDGRISLDFPVEVSGTFRRTEVRGTMNGGGPALLVRTGDGSVRIAPLW